MGSGFISLIANFIFLLGICYPIGRAQAGDYFCLPFGIRIVDIKMSRHDRFVDHRVIPKPDEAVSVRKGLTCRWKFSFILDEDSICILSGLDIATAEFYKKRLIRSAENSGWRTPKMRYQLHVPGANPTCTSNGIRNWESVDGKRQIIVQLPNRSRLVVAFEQNSSVQLDMHGLRIQLMEPGFCSRDAVYFDGNCYAVTPVRRSMGEELDAINRDSGIARLASFNSSSALQSFVAQTSADNCSPINSQEFKRYFFLPNCSQSLSLGSATSQACVIAAARSPVQSAAVMSDSDATCHVTAALCPRYQLCSVDCPSAVLMPASLIALEHLIMSVKSGCGRTVWDLMTRSAASSDFAVQPAHPDAVTLPDTFRSSLLDDMQRLISGLIYKQFIVQLYRDSSVAVRLVFDVGSSAESLTSLNWFSKERLVESWPVTDLASKATNFFSIEGETRRKNLRRFFINMNYLTCPFDRGFMAVLDTQDDVCHMYQFSHPVPRIVFSPDPSKSMSATIQDAEFMAILVR